MELIELFKFFDQDFQNERNIEHRINTLHNLFIIECKYNLDILDAINYSSLKWDSDLSIIRLLATDKLSEVIYNEWQHNSILAKSIFSSYKNFGLFSKEKNQKNIESSDSSFLKIFKTISVLKALSQLDHSTAPIRKLNYKTRIKNLKKILLEIINTHGIIQ